MRRRPREGKVSRNHAVDVADKMGIAFGVECARSAETRLHQDILESMGTDRRHTLTRPPGGPEERLDDGRDLLMRYRGRPGADGNGAPFDGVVDQGQRTAGFEHVV